MKIFTIPKQWKLNAVLILISLSVTFSILFLNNIIVNAIDIYQIEASTQTPEPNSNSGDVSDDRLSISDETCIECHGQPGLTFELQNGELLNLSISDEDYKKSIHGLLGYACVQCHSTVGDYPHPKFNASDLRDASIQLNKSCQRCHAIQYTQANDSVHSRALSNGNLNAALCTDCHNSHSINQIKDPETKKLLPEARIWTPLTCAKCHNDIYQKYSLSVHGNALVQENNLDVPTCIDCHGVHNIEDPTTSRFRIESPQLCSKCHTNPQIMNKYGISTAVLDTYVADFHGTTITLFEKQTPDADTNKPVCYDCHGVHDIKAADDPQKGLQVKENLLERCRLCHPDAGPDFPSAWLSHYIPSPKIFPVVYYVNLFYKIFIPTILGGMGLLVLMDFNKTYLQQIYKNYKRKTKENIDYQDSKQQMNKSKNTSKKNN